MSIWAKLFGQSNPADSNPADDLGPSAESDGFLMTVEELIAEGRRLQRDCVFLFAHGTGEPAATWHHRPLRDSTHLGDSPWLSIDARYIPGFEAAQAGVLTVFTSDDCETGRIDEVARLVCLSTRIRRSYFLRSRQCLRLVASACRRGWMQMAGAAPIGTATAFPTVPLWRPMSGSGPKSIRSWASTETCMPPWADGPFREPMTTGSTSCTNGYWQ